MFTSIAVKQARVIQAEERRRVSLINIPQFWLPETMANIGENA